jgi:hypothetical protein
VQRRIRRQQLGALHGKSGYMVLFASATVNYDADDRGIFESTRRFFRFTR